MAVGCAGWRAAGVGPSYSVCVASVGRRLGGWGGLGLCV